MFFGKCFIDWLRELGFNDNFFIVNQYIKKLVHIYTMTGKTCSVKILEIHGPQ